MKYNDMKSFQESKLLKITNRCGINSLVKGVISTK